MNQDSFFETNKGFSSCTTEKKYFWSRISFAYWRFLVIHRSFSFFSFWYKRIANLTNFPYIQAIVRIISGGFFYVYLFSLNHVSLLLVTIKKGRNTENLKNKKLQKEMKNRYKSTHLKKMNQDSFFETNKGFWYYTTEKKYFWSRISFAYWRFLVIHRSPS